MKKMIPLAIAALAFTVPQLASAVPIRATFDGTVTGSSGLNDAVLSDFPLGTTASFDLTFEDAPLVADASDITTFDVGPLSGWVRLGSLQWTLDAGRIWSYLYNNVPPDFPVVSYGLQMTGTGPSIAGGGASLFGLFMNITPDGLPYGAEGPKVGFRYPFDGGEFYSYANLAGNFQTSREGRSVPEPNTLLLMSSALGLLGLVRVRKRITAS
jgi:hypothetical protein